MEGTYRFTVLDGRDMQVYWMERICRFTGWKGYADFLGGKDMQVYWMEGICRFTEWKRYAGLQG